MSTTARPVEHSLARWTFTVTGVLAVLTMAAVGIIAARDQLLGVDRWCYQAGGGHSCGGGACPWICRDDQRSCALGREQVCREHRAEWVTACVPPAELPAAPRTACAELGESAISRVDR